MKIKTQLNDVFLLLAVLLIVMRLVVFKMLQVDAFFYILELFIDIFMLGFSLTLFVHKLVNRHPFRKTGFEWPLLIMLVAAGFSFFYTIDKSITLRSFLNLFSMVLFFYALVEILDTSFRRRLFLGVLFVCALVTAAFAINEIITLSHVRLSSSVLLAAEKPHNNVLKYLITHHRAISFIGWPNLLAGYLMLFLPFAGLLVFFTQRFWLRLSFLVLFLVLVGGFLSTFSFLGWLSVFLSSIFMVPLFLKNFIRVWTQRVRNITIGIIVLFFVLFVFVILKKDFSSSIAPRIIYYKNAVVLIGQKPIFGYGYATFGIASKPLVTSLNGISEHLHNTYLQWWVETGLLGFTGILLFLFIFIFKASSFLKGSLKENEGWIIFSVIWGLFAFFIDNLFSFSFIQPNVAFYAWTMLAVFIAMTVDKGEARLASKKEGFLLAIVCLNSFLVFYIVIRLYLAFTIFQNGFSSYLAGDLRGAKQSFITSSELDPWSMKYDQVAGNLSIQSYGMTWKRDYLKIAEAYYLAAIQKEPAMYVSYYALGNIYIHLQDKARAAYFLGKAAQMSPLEFSLDIAEKKEERSLF